MTFTGEVHPVAALFPMLGDDELTELAADIQTHGLLHPIVLDGDGRLLDGRNRLAACDRLGVNPSFTTYDGDSDAYALSVNVARRHLTKGQIAMVAARALLVSSSQTEVARHVGISQQRVGQAKVVLDHAPDFADLVVSGSKSLDEAYREAQQRKRAAQSVDQQMADLKEEAPDLCDQVLEERLTLTEAVAALKQRQEDHRNAIRRGQDRLRHLVDGWLQLRSLPADRLRDELLTGLSDSDRRTVLEIETLYLGGAET